MEKINVAVTAYGTLYGDGKYMRGAPVRAAFNEGDYTYHVNMSANGEIWRNRPLGSKRPEFRILYKNRISDARYNTAYLDLDAASNRRYREAIEAAITPEAIEAAYVAAEDEDRARQAAEEKAESDRLRAAMAHEMDRLRLEGKGQQAHDIEQAFAELSDDQVRRLAQIIRS